MRPSLIALTLFAASAALAAQAQSTPATVQAQGASLSGCPVGITVQQQGSPAAIWTTSLEDAHKSAAQLKALHSGVHVDLSAPRKEIKQAELAVFYLPPGRRALPVAGSQLAASEARKNFSLAAGKVASLQLDGDLLLGPVASITHISLLHIAYADDTEWKAQGSATCSIKPSLYMPIQVK